MSPTIQSEYDDFATGADYAAEGFPRDPHLTREQAEYMALVAPTEAAS